MFSVGIYYCLAYLITSKGLSIGMEWKKNNLRVLKLEAEVDGNLATKCICKRYFILDRSCVDYVMVGESVKFILTTRK